MAGLVALAGTLPEIEQLPLIVATDNDAAPALYRRLGFHPWGAERSTLQLWNSYGEEHHVVFVL